uniref:Uncharacterized protein n=1 Tax=Timema cristinae TaxID=61476 RepID=A0A7R9GW73_TIMCR|nr:unnamed protein product [Timema cristinae]
MGRQIKALFTWGDKSRTCSHGETNQGPVHMGRQIKALFTWGDKSRPCSHGETNQGPVHMGRQIKALFTWGDKSRTCSPVHNVQQRDAEPGRGYGDSGGSSRIVVHNKELRALRVGGLAQFQEGPLTQLWESEGRRRELLVSSRQGPASPSASFRQPRGEVQQHHLVMVLRVLGGQKTVPLPPPPKWQEGSALLPCSRL